MVCHTKSGRKEFAGGLGFKLPFGTLYSTNITADKETGIGNYSDQDFLNAVQRGKRRDGAMLYPAMPYTSYTYMSDEDVLAVKAYLFSLPPVARPRLKIRFRSRSTSAGRCCSGRRCSTRTRALRPTLRRSPEWNRGAYLVEALAHCGECHTPRNLAFALDNRKKFAGAVTAGWRAFNISSDKGTGVGAGRMRISPPIFRPDMPRAMARHRDRWAKPSTTVSASWPRKTSAPSSPICAAYRRRPRRPARNHGAASARLAQARRHR